VGGGNFTLTLILSPQGRGILYEIMRLTIISDLALLGTKLVQFQGVSHSQGHDIHGGKTTHAAGKASSF